VVGELGLQGFALILGLFVAVLVGRTPQVLEGVVSAVVLPGLLLTMKTLLLVLCLSLTLCGTKVEGIDSVQPLGVVRAWFESMKQLFSYRIAWRNRKIHLVQ
jgi:hypothetical protein